MLLLDYPIDHTFLKGEFTQAHEQVYNDIRNGILSTPILQRATIKKQFYLKTVSSLGLGFNLSQPDNPAAALQAMKR
jgi:hypothetical protein